MLPARSYEAEPLLTAYHFNYTHRPQRDKAWALAYWLLLLVTLGWALVSLITRPELLSLLTSSAYLDDPSHCPLTLVVGDDGPAAAVAAAAAASSAVAATAAAAAAAASTADPAMHATQLELLAAAEPRLPGASGAGTSGGAAGGAAAAAAARLTLAVATAREALWPAAARPPYHHLLTTAAAGANITHSDAAGGAAAGAGAATIDDFDAGPVAVLDGPDAGGGALPDVLLGAGGALLAVSLAAAGCVGWLFLAALRHSPWSLVLLAAGMQVGAPLASAVLASRAGHPGAALLLALTSAGLAVSLRCGASSLRLAARLLGLAAAALRHNRPLLAACAALQLCLAGAATTLLAAAALVGSAGPLVPNPLRAGGPACASPAGAPVACCALAPSAALPAYLPAAGLCLAWTLLLLWEIKVYVVSGVVAQWYFAPAGHLAGGVYCGSAASGPHVVASTGGAAASAASTGGGGGCYSGARALLASLGHALGPSFGSLCCGGAVLGATAYPRAALSCLSRLRHGPHAAPPGAAGGGGGGPCVAGCAAAAAVCPCCCCAPCCACCPCCLWLGCWGALCAALEQLSKFGTVVMALSGQGFWQATADAVGLLRRNLMDAYGLWWYLPMILHCAAAAFAAAWGYAAFWLAAASGLWAPLTGGAPPLSAAAAGALGGLAAGSAALVLSFLVSVLTSVADALFVCFVLDRDSAAVTWHELHATLAELPCCAAARAAAAEGQYVAAPYGVGGVGGVGGFGGYGGGGGGFGEYGYYAPPPPVVAAYGGEPGGAPYGAYGGAAAPTYHRVLPLPPPAPLPPGTGGLGPATAPLPALGHPVGYGSQRPQYGGGAGFWAWLRSPGGSGGGLYGVPVAGGGAAARDRNGRPQHPPPAVLSPPYSDQRFPVRPPVGSLPPMPPPMPPQPPLFGSPVRPS